MTRRLLLRLVAALAASWPLTSLRALAVPAQTLSPSQIDTLRAVADVTLPTALTQEERRAAVSAFLDWIAGYREGAEMGHGYGTTRLRTTGPSPAAEYPAQLQALEAAARATGAASLGALPPSARRAVIAEALTTPRRLTQLPSRPNGAHVVTDFMGQFFNGPEGYNLAYRAAIDREDCRGLEGSDAEPRPLSTARGGH